MARCCHSKYILFHDVRSWSRARRQRRLSETSAAVASVSAVLGTDRISSWCAIWSEIRVRRSISRTQLRTRPRAGVLLCVCACISVVRACVGRSVRSVICICAHGRMRGDPRSSPRASCRCRCCCHCYVPSSRRLVSPPRPCRENNRAGLASVFSSLSPSLCTRNTERWRSPDTLLEPAVCLASSFPCHSFSSLFFPSSFGLVFPRASHSPSPSLLVTRRAGTTFTRCVTGNKIRERRKKGWPGCPAVIHGERQRVKWTV